LSEPEILFDHRGAAGIVTLNRPKALNAVTHAMVLALRTQLDDWASDPAVTRVVITAAGERAFSAGGDIRALYDLGKAGRHGEALRFWRNEYPLNAAIKNYRKPYVALIDGIAMGGGIGISVHGSHRVAGDKFQFAMPEVGIGFFPDVGATWFLPRMAGELGTYCALTGERLTSSDGCAAGIATHRVRSPRFGALLEGLIGTVPVDAVLSAFSEPAGEGPIMAKRAAIDRLFKGDRVEDIRSHLKEGDAVTAMIINIDRKNRSINLSIKAKDNADESEAMQRITVENSGTSAGTTNLGALLKAKLDNKSQG